MYKHIITAHNESRASSGAAIASRGGAKYFYKYVYSKFLSTRIEVVGEEEKK